MTGGRETMRECRLTLQSDLFTRVKSRDPDRYIEWRSPGGFVVLLGYGEGNAVTGLVENPDGSERASTSDVTPEWLDEVLP